MNAVRVDVARLDDAVFHLDDGDVGGHGHDGIEVALGEAELQVAEGVGAIGADQGEVGRQGIFQYVGAPVDFAVLLALGQFGPHAGGGVESADAGGGGAHPFGQGTLRHQLSVQFAVVVHLDEGGDLRRVGRSREGTDHLLDLAGLDERAHVHPLVQAAGVVGNPGEFLDAQAVYGGQQVASQPDVAETGRHERHAVLHVGHGGIEIGINLVLHWDWLPVEFRRHHADIAHYTSNRNAGNPFPSLAVGRRRGAGELAGFFDSPCPTRGEGWGEGYLPAAG